MTELLRDHLGLLAAALGLAIIALRLLVIAEFQPNVAVAILAAGDPGKIALATFTGIVPIALPIVTYLALMGAIRASDSTTLRGLLIGLALAALLLAVFATPANVFVGYVVLFVVLVTTELWFGNIRQQLLNEIPKKHVDRVARAESVQIAMYAAIVLATVWFVLPPFLPRVQVSRTDGTVANGYVVADTADAIVLLSASSPKALSRVPRSEAEVVVLCRDVVDAFLDPEPILSHVMGRQLPVCDP